MGGEDGGVEDAKVKEDLVVDVERAIGVTGYGSVRDEREARNACGSDEGGDTGGGVDGVEVIGEIGGVDGGAELSEDVCGVETAG